MTSTRRILMLVVVLLLTLSVSGIALGQSDGPDPDSPIKLETPEAGSDESPSNDEPGEGEGEDGPAEPDATPVASGDVQLAAMTLDSNDLPDEWQLIQESYTSAEDLIVSLADRIDPDELQATGLVMYYDSYYINPADGNTIRTYAIEFESADGAADGFALLEDEDRTVPNGGFEDFPGLEGVGDGPSEISKGTMANGDGTTINSYDVSFTVGRFELGAAMETYDDSDADEDLVEQMARDLNDRATSVIDGESVPGIIDTLPNQVIDLGDVVTFEGYQTESEAFLIDDPDAAPGGYLSGYVTGASYSDSDLSILPYVTTGVITFQSDSDVQTALESPDSIMPLFSDLEAIEIEPLDGADDVLAFSFASAEGEGEPDSVRIFVQIEDQMVTIDVQGESDVDAALEVALGLAELQIGCVLDGDCATTGTIA